MLESQSKRLLELTLALNAAMDAHAVLDLIIERATDLLQCEAASLLVFEEDLGALRFVAVTGVASGRLESVRVPLEGSLAGTIFREDRPVVIDDAETDFRHFAAVDNSVGVRTRTLVGVPMAVEGVPTGVIEGINKRQGRFDDADVDMLSVIAAHAAIALRNTRHLESMRNAHAALRQVDVLKTQIMSITSHELRTPLATILGYSEMLREEAGGHLEVLADTVVTAGQRMRHVIESMTQLLDLLNDEVDAENFHAVDLREMLRGVIAGRDPRDQARIRLHVCQRPIPIHAHERYLPAALNQLIGNALRFSGDDLPVEIMLDVQNLVCIKIKDQGIGLSADDLQPIFDAFYQVDGELDRAYEGLGLGLTFAREVARIHGGRLEAASDGRGEGATFSLYLRA